MPRKPPLKKASMSKSLRKLMQPKGMGKPVKVRKPSGARKLPTSSNIA